ncbi:MAG: PEP-CTERM sorting domain-containing protein [Synechococcales cyanobacterium RU_4_20]|nr:PEP-CTERM sorting domain-containing protein [Synechococcales cyanobacterium RU_4_20]
MSWTGTAPTQSALIYQFKVGTSTAVPEPASLAAIALIGAAGLNLRRRSL